MGWNHGLFRSLALLLICSPLFAGDTGGECRIDGVTIPVAAPILEVVRSISTVECPADTAALGIKFSDSSNHEFEAQGPVCVDTACRLNAKGAATFKQLVENTVATGASCLARIGMEGLSAAAAKKGMEALDAIQAGSGLSAAQVKAVSGNVAFRNAARLLAIHNQSPALAQLWSGDEQMWMIAKTPVKEGEYAVRRATAREVQRAIGKAGPPPLKFMCSKETEISFESKVGVERVTSKLISDTVSEQHQEPASAVYPGLGGWPMVRLARGNMTVSAYSADSQSMLFHEYLHLIGFSHSDGLGEAVATAPLHTACQHCCFPQGLQKAREEWNVHGCDQTVTEMCAICKGQSGSTFAKFSTSEAAGKYEKHVKECWTSGKPW